MPMGRTHLLRVKREKLLRSVSAHSCSAGLVSFLTIWQ
jgi:hypothetical protein